MIPDPLPGRTLIRVVGLETYAFHGVPDAEQTVGHRYRADLELEVVETARDTDDVAGTVDYARVCAVALTVLDGPRTRTLERLARRVAADLLDAFPAASRVAVRLGKPLPPMPYVVASASVEIVIGRT